MKFAASLVAASAMALAAAQSNAVFSLNATQPTGDKTENLGKVVVFDGSLAVGPKQNASCGAADASYAHFILGDDGALNLYTDNPPKQAYVDFTDEGQGSIHFSTGVEPIDPKYKRGPFGFAMGNLWYVGDNQWYSFQGCPLHDGVGYSIAVYDGKTLAGPSCVALTADVIAEKSPVKCIYNEV